MVSITCFQDQVFPPSWVELVAVQVKAAFGCAVAHAREAIDNEANAIMPAKRGIPPIGFIAIHVGQEFPVCRTPQHRFGLVRTRLRQCKIPLRRQAGM